MSSTIIKCDYDRSWQRDSYKNKSHLQDKLLFTKDDINYKLYHTLFVFSSNPRKSDWLQSIEEPNKIKQIKKKRVLLHKTNRFPREIELFVKNNHLPNDTLEKLTLVIQKIEKFLKQQNQYYKINPELFVDPEEANSDEIKIKIEIKKDLNYIYNHFKSPIYDIVIRNLPEEILKKTLIKLDSL